ncbi:hypothetical protein V2P20_09270 [Methylobacter sp. Wu1]|uniref:hypothetical protein n=1 Tax=Methylobacter sp. Wu1 TaxID=3119359 RepID=UPI002F91D89B
MSDKTLTMLTQEDSKRVADALIDKINESDFDIAESVKHAINSVIMPTKNRWHEDWFPSILAEMCGEISRGIVAAAYSAAENKRK